MAFTQSDVDRLEAAIASTATVQSMTFGGQTFTFRSPAEQSALLAQMRAELSITAGISRTRYVVTNKGA